MRRKKSKKSWLTVPWRLFKRYLENCSIHGLKYLVQKDCHWSERLFWLICCALSWWGCSTMVIGVLNEFSSRPVATTVETNYLGWETYFPAIHFCSSGEQSSRLQASKIWKRGSLGRLMDIYWWGYAERLPEPHDRELFDDHAQMSVMNCPMIFNYCILNGVKYNCCDIMEPMWTPIGPCRVFNSIHTANSSGEIKRVPVKDGGVLAIHFHDNTYFDYMKKQISVYILDRLDLPSIFTTGERKIISKWTSSKTQIDVTQEPTYNEVEVRGVAIDKRHCRFRNEVTNLQIYKYYSFDACVAESVMNAMIEYCGCVTHIFPRTADMSNCDYAGLACLYAHSRNLTDTDKLQCTADCEEITFEFFTNFLEPAKAPVMIINLLFGPTIRYRRYIVHSELDLVVAVGSAVGLFLGASILSLVEIPYWFIVRSLDDEDEQDNNRRA